MLDYTIIAIAAITALAQSLLGLFVTTRPPAENRRFNYEVGFITIGFIGLASIVWGGFRTADTSNRIEHGVSHIEHTGDATAFLLKKQEGILTDQKRVMLEYRELLISQGAQLTQLSKPTTSQPIPPKKSMNSVSPQAKLPVETDNKLNEVLLKLQKQQSLYKALSACEDLEFPVFGKLTRLISDAADYQNGWAYTRDGDQLRKKYETWLGAANGLLAEHKDILPDTREFDAVQELNMEKGFLGLSDNGERVWHNFDERRKALTKIQQQFDKTMCKAQNEAIEDSQKAN